MTVGGSPSHAGQRAVRAGTVAAVAVGLGAVAHAGTGGCLQTEAVGGAFVVLAAASWVLARREVSGPVLLAWLGLAQLFTHLVMTAACHEAVASRHAGLVLTGHVIAVVASALALRVGEAGTWAARRLRVAGRRISRYLALRGQAATPAAAGPRQATWTGEDTPLGSGQDVRGWRGRRGPPAAAFAA